MISSEVIGLVRLSHSTAAEWAASNIPIPEGIYCYETDTRRAKIGDGVQLYRDLPYHIQIPFSEIQANLLANPNTPESVAQLTSEGTLPLDIIDPMVQNGIKMVPTLTDRDALSMTERIQSLVFVADASADTDVTTGSAVYAYSQSVSAWLRLIDFASFDFDLSGFVTRQQGLNILSDTASFVRMRAAEKATLAAIMVTQPDIYYYQNLGASAFISDFIGGNEVDEPNLMTITEVGAQKDPTTIVISTQRT